jgi:hypothetical protein
MARTAKDARSRLRLLIGLLSLLVFLGATPADAAGNSIVVADPALAVGWQSSLSLDAAGNPVISYYDSLLGDLKVLHCGNPNCTEGNSIASPDTAGNTGSFPSLALDVEGLPVVSYLDLSQQVLKILHCGDGNCLTGNSIVSAATLSPYAGPPSLVLDAAGNPVVSYIDVSPNITGNASQLQVLHCANVDCSGENNPVTIASRGVDGNTSISLDALGNPVIAFQNLRSYPGPFDPQQNLLHCGNADCTSPDNSITTPATFNNINFQALVIDENGLPVVSYYSPNEGKVRILRCGDPTCTEGNSIVTPISHLGVFLALELTNPPALTLDTMSNPVVSYYNREAAALELLHCGNPSCSENNSIAVPDPAPAEGAGSSLALDGAGNPVVSYTDNDTGRLKILHCSDPTCKAPLAGSGDANCDGRTDSVDASVVLQFAASLLPSLRCQSAADANQRGEVDAIDAALILQYVAGLLSHF